MTDRPFDAGSEADRITAELRSLSSRRVDPAPIIKTSRPFYGVKVSDLRRIARAWYRSHPTADPQEVAALADDLWHREVREEMVVAALVHGHDRQARSRYGLRTADRWARLIDNWETADALGAWLTARWVADDPERGYRALTTMAGRRNPWARRVGLVGCIGTARRPDAGRWWPQVRGIVLRCAADRESGIPKAISWVLREHVRNTASEVAAFLEGHADDLPAIAVRETRNKLRTGTKSGR
jgi:3-methyladenine DNA glycosylase AlkD